jgi:hypothetical protein
MKQTMSHAPFFTSVLPTYTVVLGYFYPDTLAANLYNGDSAQGGFELYSFFLLCFLFVSLRDDSIQLVTTSAYMYVYDDAVSELQARTFATWTLTSCMLCLLCARNPSIVPIYCTCFPRIFLLLLSSLHMPSRF